MTDLSQYDSKTLAEALLESMDDNDELTDANLRKELLASICPSATELKEIDSTQLVTALVDMLPDLQWEDVGRIEEAVAPFEADLAVDALSCLYGGDHARARELLERALNRRAFEALGHAATARFLVSASALDFMQ
jgi:hypothetical protein